MNTDQKQFIELLHQSVQADSIVRNSALQTLDLAFQSPSAFELLFSMINSAATDDHFKLLSTIYLNYWVKNNYKNISDPQLSTMITQSVFNSYVHSQGPSQKQLIISLAKIVSLDYPNCPVIKQLLANTAYPELTYNIFKQASKTKGPLQVKQDFMALGVLYRNQLEQSFQTTNIPLLNISLKILILESSILKDQQTSIYELHKHLNNPQLNLTKTIYLYQKCLIRALTRDAKIADQEIIKLLNYLLKNYFKNQFLLQNIQIPQILNVDQLLKYIQSVQKDEEIYKLVLQAIKITNIFLEIYTYNPLTIFNKQDLDSLDQGNHNKELEILFYEVYFETILQFLCNFSVLSTTQLYVIYFEPEKAFTEDSESSLAYEVRCASIELLKTALTSMKEEHISELLIKQISCFTSQPLMKNGQLLVNSETNLSQFQYRPAFTLKETELFQNILQRESFYSIIAGLYVSLKNGIEFEDWFMSNLYAELTCPNQLFLPLKIQILHLSKQFLEHSYQVSIEMCNAITHYCLEMLSKPEESISILLHSVDCLCSLVETVGNDVQTELNQVMPRLYDLFIKCQTSDSKITLFELFIQLMHFKLVNLNWICQVIQQQWSKCQKVLYKETENFLAEVDDQTKEFKNQDSLNLQGKMLQVLARVIDTSNEEQWFPFIELYFTLITESLSVQGLKEVYLAENGIILLLHTLCQLTQQRKIIQSQYIQDNINSLKMLSSLPDQEREIFQRMILKIQIALKEIIVEKTDLWQHTLLALIYLIASNLYHDKLMSETIIIGCTQLYDEIKAVSFLKIFTVLELYILQSNTNMNPILTQIISFFLSKLYNNVETDDDEIINVMHLICIVNIQNQQLCEQLICDISVNYNSLIKFNQYIFRFPINLAQKNFLGTHGQESCLSSQIELFLPISVSVNQKKRARTHSSTFLTKSQLEEYNQLKFTCTFEALHLYFQKSLEQQKCEILEVIRNMISEDSDSFKGLIQPNIQKYIIPYPQMKQDFQSILVNLQSNYLDEENLNKLKFITGSLQ